MRRFLFVGFFGGVGDLVGSKSYFYFRGDFIFRDSVGVRWVEFRL